MFIGDTILRFSKKSNPEDSIVKELRFLIKFGLNIQQTVYLKAKNPVSLKWEYWYYGAKKGSGTYTSNNVEERIFRVTTKEEVEFIITGSCDEISLRSSTGYTYNDTTMITYNLDGIKTIPAFSSWNMNFINEFPAIWNYNKYKNTTHTGAFTGCTYLTNYNNIPDTWK